MADRRWIAAHRRQQLLDVADEPQYQSRPSHLASGRLGLFSTLIHACDTGWRSVDK